MKAKLFLKYFSEFIIGVTITILIIIMTLKNTILNKNYVIKKIDENNYYNDILKKAKEEMSDCATKYDFYISVLDDVMTVEEIKIEFDKVIENKYKNEIITIDSTKTLERLERNITVFLNETKKEMNETNINEFINEILNIYESNLLLESDVNDFLDSVLKTNDLLNSILIIAIVLLALFSLYIFLESKKMPLVTVSITIGILIFITYFLMKANINIENVNISNESIFLIIEEIYYDVLDKISILGIIGLIIGIISFALNEYAFISGKKDKKQEN